MFQRNIIVQKVPIVDLHDFVFVHDEFHKYKVFEFVFTNGTRHAFAFSKDTPVTAREFVSELRKMANDIEDKTKYYEFETK